jgi:glycine/D-amino acid oxidase-like deaminating enzyme
MMMPKLTYTMLETKWTQRHYSHSLEVIAHDSGIRPASPDRRPMVGKHPAFDHLYIFNGLGAKGYMLAPSLAEMLCNALIQQTTLLADLHPYRFNPK